MPRRRRRRCRRCQDGKTAASRIIAASRASRLSGARIGGGGGRRCGRSRRRVTMDSLRVHLAGRGSPRGRVAQRHVWRAKSNRSAAHCRRRNSKCNCAARRPVAAAAAAAKCRAAAKQVFIEFCAPESRASLAGQTTSIKLPFARRLSRGGRRRSRNGRRRRRSPIVVPAVRAQPAPAQRHETHRTAESTRLVTMWRARLSRRCRSRRRRNHNDTHK